MALTRNPRTRKIEKKGKRKQPPGLREANQENKRRSPANEFSSAEACPVSGAFTSFFFVFIHFLLFQRRPSANFVGLAAKRCYEGGRQKKHNRKEPFPFKAKKKGYVLFFSFFPRDTTQGIPLDGLLCLLDRVLGRIHLGRRQTTL